MFWRLVAFFAIALSLSSTGRAEVAVGAKLPLVEIKGDDGGRTDDKPWSSDTIKGKVWLLFYVDPDEKSANEDMEEALKAADFPKDKHGSIGIINMGATWLPDGLIATMLKSKQEEFPDVVYVKDLSKVLVKKWQLKDDSYVVLAFDKQGKVLFHKAGTLSKDDTKKLIEIVRAHLDDPA